MYVIHGKELINISIYNVNHNTGKCIIMAYIFRGWRSSEIPRNQTLSKKCKIKSGNVMLCKSDDSNWNFM